MKNEKEQHRILKGNHYKILKKKFVDTIETCCQCGYFKIFTQMRSADTVGLHLFSPLLNNI